MNHCKSYLILKLVLHMEHMEQIEEAILPDVEGSCFLPKYTLNISDEDRDSARQKIRQITERVAIAQKILVEDDDGMCIGYVFLRWPTWAPQPYYCCYVNYPLFNFTKYSEYEHDVNWYNILNDIYLSATTLFGDENILPFPNLSYGDKSVIGWDHDNEYDRVSFTPLELAIKEVKFFYYLIKLYESTIIKRIDSLSNHDDFFDMTNV